MNWNSCVMPCDISLLNFQRPFRGPRWRGDSFKILQKKVMKMNLWGPSWRSHPSSTTPDWPRITPALPSGQWSPVLPTSGRGPLPRGCSWDFGELSVWGSGCLWKRVAQCPQHLGTTHRRGNCAPHGAALCSATHWNSRSRGSSDGWGVSPHYPAENNACQPIALPWWGFPPFAISSCCLIFPTLRPLLLHLPVLPAQSCWTSLPEQPQRSLLSSIKRFLFVFIYLFIFPT